MGSFAADSLGVLLRTMSAVPRKPTYSDGFVLYPRRRVAALTQVLLFCAVARGRFGPVSNFVQTSLIHPTYANC